MSTSFIVFNAQLTGSMIVLGLITFWYLMPALRRLEGTRALVPPLLVGATRYMGLVFLVPSLTPGMPAAFAIPTAFGDAASAVLALAAALASQARSPVARPLAWAYVVLGGGDLVYGFFQGFLNGLWDHLDGVWTYLAYGAPAVILSLMVTAVLLVRPNPSPRAAAA